MAPLPRRDHESSGASFKEQLVLSEQELKHSWERYRALFTSIRDAILVADTDRRIIDCNPAFTDLFGYQLEEIMGKKTKYVYGNEEDFHVLGKKLKEHMGDRHFFIQIAYQKKSGEVFQGETNVFYFRNNEGNVEGFIGLIRDISNTLELQEKQQFLQSLLKHDLANVLMIIDQYLELLDSIDLPEKADVYLQRARDTSEEGIDLINRVSALQNADISQREQNAVPLSLLEGVIQERIESRQGKTRLRIEMNLPKRDILVKGGNLWTQVFENLIVNAIQHSGGSRIKVSEKLIDNEILISVEDDGKGIPDDLKSKVFEKGFTYGENPGSGMGLYLTKRIVESYDGRIELHDSDLGGARFDVYMLAVSSDAS